MSEKGDEKEKEVRIERKRFTVARRRSNSLVEIRLPQRPSMRQTQTLQLGSKFRQSVEYLFEDRTRRRKSEASQNATRRGRIRDQEDEQVSKEWERRLHAELGCPERSRNIPREDRREC